MFLDNFSLLCVEICLIQTLDNLLSPKAIDGLPTATLDQMMDDSPFLEEKQVQATKELEELKKIVRDFEAEKARRWEAEKSAGGE